VTLTLAIDVGGSHLKAAVLDPGGTMTSERARMPTPYPCPPDVLVGALRDLVVPLPSYERVSVGFPGMVRDGRVRSAPNLSRLAGPGSEVSPDIVKAWSDVDLAGSLADVLGAPTRVVNDAEMQGAAVVRGEGLELIVTLGTGCGTGLFVDGRLAPHLELGQHPFRHDKTYDEVLGEAARKHEGSAHWNRQVARALRTLDVLLRPDRIYVGGGNSKHVTLDLAELGPQPHVELVDNIAGLQGGARRWALSG